ncbi:MAG: winged helix-turn-helix domain-containing protein, partial [Sulfurimonas sp.]
TKFIPFEALCNYIHITNFEEAWQHYLDIRPNIILIHLASKGHLCQQIINKIKKVDPDSLFLILAAEELKETINGLTADQHVRTLYGAITKEEVDEAFKELIHSMNSLYFIDNQTRYEPFNSSFVHSDERTTKLTQQENKLLTYLFENKERIVSYDEIEDYLWGDMDLHRNTLTSMISNIRRKANNSKFIKNYSNQGYKITL